MVSKYPILLVKVVLDFFLLYNKVYIGLIYMLFVNEY